MIRLAQGLVKNCMFKLPTLKITMNIRYVKPVVSKLIEQSPNEQQYIDFQLLKLLEEQEKLGPCSQYDQIFPGMFRTYTLQQKQQNQWSLRSKRHRVAKLKRLKRKHGKKTHIQNN